MMIGKLFKQKIYGIAKSTNIKMFLNFKGNSIYANSLISKSFARKFNFNTEANEDAKETGEGDKGGFKVPKITKLDQGLDSIISPKEGSAGFKRRTTENK